MPAFCQREMFADISSSIDSDANRWSRIQLHAHFSSCSQKEPTLHSKNLRVWKRNNLQVYVIIVIFDSYGISDISFQKNILLTILKFCWNTWGKSTSNPKNSPTPTIPIIILIQQECISKIIGSATKHKTEIKLRKTQKNDKKYLANYFRLPFFFFLYLTQA